MDDVGKFPLVIEVTAADAVHWMSPHDADEKLLLTFGRDPVSTHGTGLNAVFTDAAVHFISADVSTDERRAWFVTPAELASEPMQ